MSLVTKIQLQTLVENTQFSSNVPSLQKQIDKQEYILKVIFNQLKIRNEVEKNTHIKINALKFNKPITFQIHDTTNEIA